MLRAVQGARQLGRFARGVQRRSYQGAEFSKKLGQSAGEFQRSKLGGFITQRSPLAGGITRGIIENAPTVEKGLRRLGDIAGKVKELERLELGQAIIPEAPAMPAKKPIVMR